MELPLDTTLVPPLDYTLTIDAKYTGMPSFPSIVHTSDQALDRSLEILLQTGQPQSAAIEAEQSCPSRLRYSPTVCFWVDSDESVLSERLSKRIFTMEARGLQRELFHTLATLVLTSSPSQGQELILRADQLDYTQGVLQAIGFKEYAPLFDHVLKQGWLEGCVEGDPLDWQQLEALLKDPTACMLQQQGRDAMDRATVKYAKRQLTWIKNRLLIGQYSRAWDTHVDISKLLQFAKACMCTG
jgi:tRNA A37 N6-isopentenylltransferase MiaA